ncbi:MAG TPA: hypothetical protein PK781_03675 [Terrimesophilobacter sp.]|nr:hypothetical protein [Terrimesophilobacter sp.]HRP99542.1 hypothetical protein [Terrimesophilobacter sp.]
MPRSNRPRPSRGSRARRGVSAHPEHDELDVSRVLFGFKRQESKRDGLWNVQPVSAAGAIKTYVCPGCSQDVTPGTAHVVTWRADGLMGENDDLAARRHWHSHCWKIA